MAWPMLLHWDGCRWNRNNGMPTLAEEQSGSMNLSDFSRGENQRHIHVSPRFRKWSVGLLLRLLFMILQSASSSSLRSSCAAFFRSSRSILSTIACPDKPGPVDSNLSHPLSQSIVNFDCDCPHWRHYLEAVPKYGLMGITRSLPAIPPRMPFFSRN